MKTLSLVAQSNIDYLSSFLKLRLADNSTVKHRDTNNNIVYVDCDIYTKDMLQSFLILALSDFNQVPKFTNYSFDDSDFVERFAAILVDGAVLYCLSSRALIERGREFTIHDSGVSFYPPSISEMLNTQYSILFANYWDKLKLIKSAL